MWIYPVWRDRVTLRDIHIFANFQLKCKFTHSEAILTWKESREKKKRWIEIEIELRATIWNQFYATSQIASCLSYTTQDTV